MHFLLSSMSVVYVLTTPIPKDSDDATVEQLRKRAKWDNNDYVCRGLIFNGMSDSLFDIYQSVESSKELWDSLDAKYMSEDASSKKFLVSNFTNYKMIDSRPDMEQYNELLGILGDFKHTLKHLKEELTLIELDSHLRIEKSLRVQDSDKPKGNNITGPSVVNMVEHNNSSMYNDNKGVNVGNKANGSGTKDSVDGSSKSLKGHNMFNKSLQWVDSGAIVHVCKDRCWFMTYESLKDGSILHMGNELIALVHGQGCVDLRLNIIYDNIASAFMSTSKLNDSIIWHARLGHVYFKRMQDMSKDGLIPAFDMDIEKCKTCMLTKITKKPFQNVKCETKVLELIHSDLCDLHATSSLENKKYFVIFIDDALRDAIFDEIDSSVPRPSLGIPNESEDIDGSVVPQEVTDEFVTQQPETELRKGKRNRTPKNFGLEFQLYLTEGTRDEVSDQHSYFFNVEDDPKTSDEVMKSQDVAF
ncbi:zinc finger, CCHC-type containing protein [Tanacetum coccineum]